MSKTRVYQIANELKMSNEDVLAKLKELEINAVDKDSELEEDEVELALEILKDEVAATNGNTITIDGKLTVQELATKLDKSASEIIMKLMKMGTMATINQEISFEIGSLVASEYGFDLVEGSADDEEELAEIKSNIHIVGIDSDLFFMVDRNRKTFKTIKAKKQNVYYHEITSPHGHDAFLIEYEQLKNILNPIFD